MDTWASHLHPVGELSGASKPPLVAGAAYCCLQLFVAHKPCEERQINHVLCHGALQLLIFFMNTLLSCRVLATPERVIEAQRCARTVSHDTCLIRL